MAQSIDMTALNSELSQMEKKLAEQLSERIANGFVDEFDGCLDECKESITGLEKNIDKCKQSVSGIGEILDQHQTRVSNQVAQLQSDLERSAKLITEANENNDTQTIVENTKKLQEAQNRINEQISFIQKRTNINSVLTIVAVVLLLIILVGNIVGFL